MNVYYELYVDILFLANFMMDYILLLLVRKMLSSSATHGNVCVGALLGSALTCMFVAIPIPYPFIKLVCFHLLVNTCMIRVGLKIKTIRSMIKAWLLLYIGGFLLGGIMEFFHQYVRVGSLLLALAIVGYYLALGIWKFLGYLQRWNQCHCMVELYLGEKRYQIKGIIDTGNSLRDPISGQPVSILDQKAAGRFFGAETPKNIRYIPYHSIGKQEGVLPAFQLDKMCVLKKEPVWIQAPIIGVSEEEISAGGEYEMILNPNLL